MTTPRGVTALLGEWSRGNHSALNQLVPLVYAELRRVAARQLRSERSNHTLQPTALVHELYLRLVDEAKGVAASNEIPVLALDNALDRLKEVDSDLARIVELRAFGGLTIEEAAHVLKVSPSTAKRDWRTAKAWLNRELASEDP